MCKCLSGTYAASWKLACTSAEQVQNGISRTLENIEVISVVMITGTHVVRHQCETNLFNASNLTGGYKSPPDGSAGHASLRKFILAPNHGLQSPMSDAVAAAGLHQHHVVL